MVILGIVFEGILIEILTRLRRICARRYEGGKHGPGVLHVQLQKNRGQHSATTSSDLSCNQPFITCKSLRTTIVEAVLKPSCQP